MNPVEDQIGRVGDGEQEEEISRDDARISAARANKHQKRDEIAEHAEEDDERAHVDAHSIDEFLVCEQVDDHHSIFSLSHILISISLFLLKFL